MAEGRAGVHVRKRVTRTSSEEVPKKKRSLGRSEGVECCFTGCEDIVTPSESRVEVKSSVKVEPKTKFFVAWSENGEAVFHKRCWESLLRNARARNRKKVTICLSDKEKSMIKEANQTVEYHDSEDEVVESCKRIARLINKAKHCVVFTGAGISTSAGIGDYRGKSGKWTELDRKGPATTESTNEEGVAYEQLRPTYTHEALAKLVAMGKVKHIISQNGDGLHILSGMPSEKLSELHGNVFLEKCEDCDHQYYRSFYVLDDDASQYYEQLNEEGTTELTPPPNGIQCKQCELCHRTGRTCEQSGCHGYLKDSIINFGDDLEKEIYQKAESEATQSDLILSLGTTMTVTPACDLVLKSHDPLRLIIVNRQKTGFDSLCTRRYCGEELGVRVCGDCDGVMRNVMNHLVPEKDRKRWEKDHSKRMNYYDTQRMQK